MSNNKLTTVELEAVLCGELDDTEELKSLCKELLTAVDKLTEEPYFIVQPFFGIVQKYRDIIKKHGLLGE